jgi:flagellum-specific peptidoglycan hydrolase FlgJ
MRRALLTGFFLFATSTAFAQPVSGECTGPECPFWIDDVNAAANAADCGLSPDVGLEQKFRSGKKLTPDEFVRFMAPMAQQSERETGVPASVTIAQAALETGWGKTTRQVANNLFGIKGAGNNGSVKLWTREYVRGRWVKVRARFAAYQTLGDSVAAHGRLISENRIYARAMAVKDQGPAAFARALQRSGYATDPKYASKLLSIIDKRDLTQYDGSRECPA